MVEFRVEEKVLQFRTVILDRPVRVESDTKMCGYHYIVAVPVTLEGNFRWTEWKPVPQVK